MAASALSASPIQTHTQLPTTCSGKAPHAGALRDQLLARDLDALAVRRELQPVIHAAQRIALEAAERQRREAMRAAILKRHDAAVGRAIQHQRLVDDGAGVDAARLDLVRPGRDVPGIADPHAVLPSRQHIPLPIHQGRVVERKRYSITSSARPRRPSGSVRSSAFAVFALITTLELGRLLDRDVGGLLAAQYLGDEVGDAGLHGDVVDAVRHQAARLGVALEDEHGGPAAFDRQRGDL